MYQNSLNFRGWMMSQMKKYFLIFGVLISTQVRAEIDMKLFLKHCAYGTVFGALAGTVSLVAVDKPSDHLNNISRGASLGLYSGIIYSLVTESHYSMGKSDTSSKYESTYFYIQPDLNQKSLVLNLAGSF